jgi:hypothetical protein
MVTLKAFIPTGKQCKWPGCCNEAVKVKFDIEGKRIHCIKHQLIKLSGRVSHKNWQRDHYREHMTSVCAITGTTWKQSYKEVQLMSKVLGVCLSRRETIRRTSQQFQVDHIDGEHRNNDPSNLQTLAHRAHKFKTDVMGDANPMRYKR